AHAARDQHLAVDRAVVDREAAEIDGLDVVAALRAGLDRAARLRSQLRRELVERVQRRRRVLGVERERQLRDPDPGPRIESDLAAEQREQLVERDAVLLLQLRDRLRRLRIRLQLLELVGRALALEVEERKGVGWHAADQRGGEVRGGRRAAARRAADPNTLVLGAGRGRDVLQLVE